MPRPQIPYSMEYVLLGLLAQQPMHGYDLYKEISANIPVAMLWEIKQSQLYALLEKLEKDCWLASKIIPGGTHPSRRQFFLTDTGREALETWLRTPVEHARDMRQDFLARLYFAAQSGPRAARELVARQRAECQGWLERLRSQADGCQKERYEMLIYNFRILQVQAILAWLDECAQEIAP